MMNVTCQDLSFELQTAPCDVGVDKAHLTGFMGSYVVDAVTDPDGNYTIGPVPDHLPNGVYRLNLDTPCRCYELMINLTVCEPPAVPSKHTHTHPDGDKIAPECCPDD